MKTATSPKAGASSAHRTTFFTCRYAVLFAGACALTFLTVNYRQHKVSDCNQLVEIVNEAAETQPNKLGRTIAEDNVFLMKAANQLDKYAIKLDSLRLKDQKVKGFQSRFAQLYRETSQASSNVVFAPIDNLQVVAHVNRTLIESREREAPLVREINRYCHSI